jgi:hypothetical protein
VQYCSDLKTAAMQNVSSTNCVYNTNIPLYTLPSSSTDGFFVTVGKFAGCIGAAAFAWIAITPFVVSTLMITRSRVRRINAEEQIRTNGEFVVLGNDVDLDEEQLERGSYNGTRTQDRLPLSMYHRLVESAELKPLTPQDRDDERLGAATR